MINILFIGDIVGAAGRKIVSEKLAGLKKEYAIDLVIANGENSAHGKGISAKVYHSLLSYGIDVITMGNHTFAKDCIYDFIEEADKMVLPLNITTDDIGQEYKIFEVKGQRICVFNVLGNVFMVASETSCFSETDRLLSQVEADLYFCDFHGEATSEKIVYAYNYQDKIQAIIGTHTHVQTADERLIGKAAFISDVGMCGVYESILGRDIDEAMEKLIHQKPTRFTMAEGPAIFCAVVVSIDEIEKRAVNICRIQILPESLWRD